MGLGLELQLVGLSLEQEGLGKEREELEMIRLLAMGQGGLEMTRLLVMGREELHRRGMEEEWGESILVVGGILLGEDLDKLGLGLELELEASTRLEVGCALEQGLV